MANECQPLFDPGDAHTCFARRAVIGKRFVTISGARSADLVQVAPAGDGGTGQTPTVQGVAGRDVAASANVTVYREGIVPITAGGTVAAGDPVTFDSVGRAVKATGTTGAGVAKHGHAVDDATIGLDCFVALELNTAFVAP